MAKAKGKINVNGGAGGSRWCPRAVAKQVSKKARRAQDKSKISEVV
jgi:hypothetical protein